MAQIAYWILHPSASWGSDPTGAQIAAGNIGAGTAAAYLGNESGFSTVSGTRTITEATTVTGLTAGTLYKQAWVVWDSTTGTYSNVVVSEFSTIAELIVSGIASVEIFGATSVTAHREIIAPGIASAEVFGDVTVISGAEGTVVASGVASAEAFGSVGVTGIHGLSVASIASVEIFGASTVARHNQVVPAGIATAETFGLASLTAYSPVVLAGIASAETFGGTLVLSDAVGSGASGRWGFLGMAIDITIVRGTRL